MGKQERSTGGGGEELSELESILEELIKIGEDTDQRVEKEATRQILVDEDRAKAAEMRKRAMKSMGETRERHGESSREEKRRSARQSMDWLEKAMAEEEQKQQEEDNRKKNDNNRRRSMWSFCSSCNHS